MKNVLAVVGLFVVVIILTLSDFGKDSTVIYDCRDAHWHPDVPIAVKRECQKLMQEELRKLREEEIRKRFINT